MFGLAEGRDSTCEAVDLGLITKACEALKVTTLVVLFIAPPWLISPLITPEIPMTTY